MSLPSTLAASIAKARARVDALCDALDRLALEAEDLAARRIDFKEDGDELMQRLARLQESDLAARAQLHEDYHALAVRLEEHCRILVDASQSYRAALSEVSTTTESDSALGRSAAIFVRGEAISQAFRRMQQGPAARNGSNRLQ